MRLAQALRLPTRLATPILLVAATFALSGRGPASQLRAEQPLPRFLIVTDAPTFGRTPVPIRWQVLSSEPSRSEATGLGSLNVRGSSSSPNPKRPYKLEIHDALGNDHKISLLGMAKESDWILYASFTDKTFIRDVLAYDLWRDMGYYAPRWRYIELYITTNSVPLTNHSSIDPSIQLSSSYGGIYVLLEKIKRGKHRLNIQKLPRDSFATFATSCSNDFLSGGYIFKKDRLNPGEKGFISSVGMNFAYEEPKERDITPAQRQWLTNHINEFEAVLFGKNFSDPENGYAKYIDTDSFIDYHWMVEMGRNMDAFFMSRFFYKDRGGKIKAGPIWDWDFGFGNVGIASQTNRWVADSMTRGAHYHWYNRLFQDSDFLQRYIDRWSELRTNIFATSNILARIDALAAQIEPHAERNYQRWPYLDINVGGTHFRGKTYRSHVDYLKNWIEGRLAWIDSQDFPKPVLTVIPPLLSSSLPFVQNSSSGSDKIQNPSSPSVTESSQIQNSAPLSTSLPSRPSVQDASPFRVGHPDSIGAPPSPLASRSSVQSDSAFRAPPSALSMSCQPGAGSIFYTTNNTDPRLPGGHVSPNALEYKSPIPITPGLQVKARVLSDYGLWSAPALFP